MAPLKFEDNIKEKLEGRTIQPSQDAWEKLANQLDKNKSQKNMNTYWWLGLAASIIGVIMVTVLYQNSEIVDDKNQLVEVNEELDVPEKRNQLVEVKDVKKEEEKVDAELIDKEVKVMEEQFVKKINKDTRVVKTIKSSRSSSKAIEENNNNSITKEESNKILETPIVDKNTIDIKLAEVITKVKELENSAISVTDEEIEALLYKAQKEILIEQINSNNVSASALLQEVELELDESFKERVFEALKIGFDKLKTAVAEREN